VIKTAIKFMLFAALAVVLYKGMEVYAGVKWSTYVVDCADQLQMCSLGRQRAPDAQIAAAVTELYACVAKRQPAFESVFVPLPKSHADISSDPLDYKYAEAFCKK
jgi:hypothetical protein